MKQDSGCAKSVGWLALPSVSTGTQSPRVLPATVEEECTRQVQEGAGRCSVHCEKILDTHFG